MPRATFVMLFALLGASIPWGAAAANPGPVDPGSIRIVQEVLEDAGACSTVKSCGFGTLGILSTTSDLRYREFWRGANSTSETLDAQVAGAEASVQGSWVDSIPLDKRYTFQMTRGIREGSADYAVEIIDHGYVVYQDVNATAYQEWWWAFDHSFEPASFALDILEDACRASPAASWCYELA
jgi:hypothetical protein